MSSKPTLRLAFIGWGAIARTTVAMLRDAPVHIVAVAVRDGAVPQPDLPIGAQLITEAKDLASVEPDIVAEAVSRESVGPWGRAALEAGADFIVSSVSAFADTELASMRSNTKSSSHRSPGGAVWPKRCAISTPSPNPRHSSAARHPRRPHNSPRTPTWP